MANVYQDVIRLESDATSLVSKTRNGQMSFETTGRKRALHKMLSGEQTYFLPQAGLLAADCTYVNASLPGAATVADALTQLVDRTSTTDTTGTTYRLSMFNLEGNFLVDSPVRADNTNVDSSIWVDGDITAGKNITCGAHNTISAQWGGFEGKTLNLGNSTPAGSRLTVKEESSVSAEGAVVHIERLGSLATPNADNAALRVLEGAGNYALDIAYADKSSVLTVCPNGHVGIRCTDATALLDISVTHENLYSPNHYALSIKNPDAAHDCTNWFPSGDSGMTFLVQGNVSSSEGRCAIIRGIGGAQDSDSLAGLQLEGITYSKLGGYSATGPAVKIDGAKQDTADRANKTYVDDSHKILTVSNYGMPKVSIMGSGVFMPLQSDATPTYIKGGIFFNTTLNKLMVGGATGWETVTSSL